MCGVIGASFTDVGAYEIELVENLILESRIRGRHATGVSYVKGGVVYTIKEHLPADEFLNKYAASDFIDDDGSLTMIGHTRYSTSSLEYNQPIGDKTLAIVHNGVISQEPKSQWPYECETDNDSELIYQCLLAGEHPLKQFPKSSQAVVVLSQDKKIAAWRNGERPLHYSRIGHGIVFTSTSDIAQRAGIEPSNTNRCFPGLLHTFSGENFLHLTEIIAVEHMADLQP